MFEIPSEKAFSPSNQPLSLFKLTERNILNIARQHITYALDFNRHEYRIYEELL